MLGHAHVSIAVRPGEVGAPVGLSQGYLRTPWRARAPARDAPARDIDSTHRPYSMTRTRARLTRSHAPPLTRSTFEAWDPIEQEACVGRQLPKGSPLPHDAHARAREEHGRHFSSRQRRLPACNAVSDLARPSGVLGPVESPPCHLQMNRPFFMRYTCPTEQRSPRRL